MDTIIYKNQFFVLSRIAGYRVSKGFFHLLMIDFRAARVVMNFNLFYGDKCYFKSIFSHPQMLIT